MSLRLLSDVVARSAARASGCRLRVAAALNGLAPQDVRVEFIAQRLLPEAELSPPPLSSYGHGERDGIWSAVLAGDR